VKERKVFFFEKKKQKTFGYGAALAGSARNRQKFLGFFSKKELLSYLTGAGFCSIA